MGESQNLYPDQSGAPENDWLRRLEDNLAKIEADEILQGHSDEILEKKGFVGNKDVVIERVHHRETTEHEKLHFGEGVEYKRLCGTESFTSITIKSLLYLRDVEAGMVIAQREPDETIPFFAGKNVDKSVDEKGEQYRATIRGKVLIIKDCLAVFPSDIDCSISLKIVQNATKVVMDCEAGYGRGRPLSLEMVLVELQRLHVFHGIQKDSVSAAIFKANETREAQHDVVIAEATLPVRGTDGRIEYTFPVDAEKNVVSILPDGRIDFRSITTIPTARVDQLLATIHEPGLGINGFNVCGDFLEAQRGSEATLVAGNGVRVSEDGRQFFAVIKGCIMLNAPVIEVLDIYVVTNDIDYSTGNINFNGNVYIQGTVRDGFEVRAEGDIIVQKSVEAARIIAGRDVRISGGVIGRGKGFIGAGRDVYVEYLQNSTIEAQGNAYINDFSVNSSIFCNFLEMKKKHGSILGGETCAQRGIDILNLGSKGGIKTIVTAGTDFMVRKKIAEIESAITFCCENIGKIDSVLKPFLTHLNKEPENHRNKTHIIRKTIEKRNELLVKQRVMSAKCENLKKRLEIDGTCFIKVKNACYEDVLLTIKQLKLKTTEIKTNVSYYDDSTENKIKIGTC